MIWITILKDVKDFIAVWWKELIIICLVLASVWYVRGLQSDVKRLNRENSQLTEYNKTLKTTISETNKSLTLMSQSATKTEEAFKRLGIEIDSQTATLASKIAKVGADRKPKTCTEAIEYLIDAKKDYK